MSEKHSIEWHFLMLTTFRIMQPIILPVVVFSAAGLVVSLFLVGKAAEALRLFILFFFIGGCAVAVLRLFWVIFVNTVRCKLRDSNDRHKLQKEEDLFTTKIQIKDKWNKWTSTRPANYLLRPSIYAYMTWILWAGGCFIFALYTYFYGFDHVTPRDRGVFRFMLACLIPALVSIAATARIRIAIHNDTITYRDPLTGDKVLNIREISSAQVKWHPGIMSSFSIIITPYPEIMEKPLIISSEFFSKKDLQIVYLFLGEKLLDREDKKGR